MAHPNLSEQIGTVVALYRYPVKSLRGESLATAEVQLDGFAGDRRRALLVRTPGHARSGKPYRGKEHRKLHTVAVVGEAQALARDAGVTLEADEEQGRYFDAEPVSIVFEHWLRELEALAGRTVEPLRFRPNIVAAAAPSFTASEAALTARRLHVGEVTLDVVEPIVRCVTPSYDIATGDPDRALQRTIAMQRGNLMGVYCRVVAGGTIEAGAPITVDP
jgi:uncharacterized protein YcbX